MRVCISWVCMCMRLQRSMHGEQVAGACTAPCSPACLLHRTIRQGCVIEDSLLMGADYYEQYEECEAFTVSPVWLSCQLPITASSLNQPTVLAAGPASASHCVARLSLARPCTFARQRVACQLTRAPACLCTPRRTACRWVWARARTSRARLWTRTRASASSARL